MTHPLRPRPLPLLPGSAPLPEALGALSLTGGGSGRSLSKLSALKLPTSSITCMYTSAPISSALPRTSSPPAHAIQSNMCLTQAFFSAITP